MTTVFNDDVVAAGFSPSPAGDITGNVTGNVTGDVTGNLTGGVKWDADLYNANGAIAVPAVSKLVLITKGTAATMTLVAPTAGTHDGVRLDIIASAAAAHTITVTAGFNGAGAGKDVATFGGAVGDGMTIVAYQGVWYVENLNGVTLA